MVGPELEGGNSGIVDCGTPAVWISGGRVTNIEDVAAGAQRVADVTAKVAAVSARVADAATAADSAVKTSRSVGKAIVWSLAGVAVVATVILILGRRRRRKSDSEA